MAVRALRGLATHWAYYYFISRLVQPGVTPALPDGPGASRPGPPPAPRPPPRFSGWNCWR